MHLLEFLLPLFEYLPTAKQIQSREGTVEERGELGQGVATVDGGVVDHDGQLVVEGHRPDAALGEGVFVDDADHRRKDNLRQFPAIVESEGRDAAHGDIVDGGGNNETAPERLFITGQDAKQAVGHEDRHGRSIHGHRQQRILILEELLNGRAPLRDILPDIPVEMNALDDAQAHLPFDLQQILIPRLQRGLLLTGSMLFDFLGVGNYVGHKGTILALQI